MAKHVSARMATSAGLLVGLVVLGCQAPPAADLAEPRAVVSLGKVALDPATDLALRMAGPCGDGGGYGLAQVARPLNPRIKWVQIEISGSSLTKAKKVEIAAADFGNDCWKTLEFDLPPGEYLVKMVALDVDRKPVSTDQSQVVLGKPGAAVELVCDFETWDPPIDFSPFPTFQPTWAPSPAPTTPPPSPNGSPSPTPTPVGSPTGPGGCVLPSPHVYPAPIVANPAPYFERIHGLNADERGNVYLQGLRPKPWADDYRIGHMVEINPGGIRSLAEPLNKGWVLYDADANLTPNCDSTWVTGFAGAPPDKYPPRPQPPYTANQTWARFDNGFQNTAYLRDLIPGYFVRPWGASAQHPDAVGFVSAPGEKDPAKLAGYMIVSWQIPPVVWVDRRALVGGREAATERPLSLILDPKNRRPIWSCKRGILAPASGNRPKADPQVLVSRPVYGLTRVHAGHRAFSNEVLYTTYEDGDPKVYHVDLDRPATSKVAYTFKTGVPHRIERGLDGAFYVLLQQGPLPRDGAGDPYMHEFPGSRNVRVVQLRFDDANDVLYDPRLVADSFTTSAPSW